MKGFTLTELLIVLFIFFVTIPLLGLMVWGMWLGIQALQKYIAS